MADARGIRSGRAFVELFADDGPLQRGLRTAQQRIITWGAAMSRAGLATFAYGAARVGAAFLAATTFGSTGEQLERLSASTRESVESLSALAYVATQAGGDLGTLQSAMEGLDHFLLSARDGSAEANQTLSLMGVTLEQLNHQTRSDQFRTLADGLTRVDSELRRSSFGAQIFGGAASTLMPVLRGGSAEIDRLTRRAEALGLVWSGDDAAAAVEFNRSLAEMKSLLMRLVAVMGGQFAPILRGFVQTISRALPLIISFVKENKALLIAFVAGAAIDVALGAAMVLLAKAFALATLACTALSIIVKILNFDLAILASPILLIGLALVGVVAAIVYFTGVWDSTLEWWRGLMADFAATFDTAWGGIQDAIEAGDLSLAFQVAWAGIKVIWFAGINAINMALLEWRFFLDTWIDRITSGWAGLFIAFWATLQVVWNAGLTSISLGWFTVIYSLQSAWEVFAAAVLSRWTYVTTLIRTRSTAAAAAAAQEITDEAESRIAGLRANLESRARAGSAEHDRILAEGRQQIDILQRDLDHNEAQRARQLEESRAAGEEEVAGAQAELDALRREAAAAAGQQRDAANRAQGGVDAATGIGRISSQGTFSAAEAAAASGGPVNRIEQNTRISADALRSIQAAIANGQLAPTILP